MYNEVRTVSLYSGSTTTIYTSFPHGAIGLNNISHASGSMVWANVSINGNAITVTIPTVVEHVAFVLDIIGY